MTHHTDTNELIVKLMPSGEHETAHLSLAEALNRELDHISTSFENLLVPVEGSSRCSGPSSSKEADSSYKPISRRYKNDWSTIVFESGRFEGLGRLRFDAQWWLVNSGGEYWYYHLNKASTKEPLGREMVPSTGSQHKFQCATKMKEICVTQNLVNPAQPGPTPPCTVTGGSLVLEF